MYLVLVESSICKQTKIKVDITCLFTVVKKELELRCPINPLMIGQITCVFGKVGHVYIVQLVCANKNKMYRGGRGFSYNLPDISCCVPVIPAVPKD